ncbi:4-(cytidine 5'-diphospho)-2-C-methyl-D-erythritol kinase [Holdemania massiliensis]|uniref:4-(cytidine 5'-diphospho)-2-C-methyl-D-erythritol kinase n=1 Tax=Holdemania massiliensis TaxID=1468449 RepID=UPI0002DAF37A|nr:4-(cytidine 5'-diphospho)-2-C-methyl-D-erythritol kinase [Holdemania massiliensis]
MKQRAYAKINLCLDVVCRREDGYHELEMIMAPVNLYDTLNFEFCDELRLQSNVPYLPLDRRNTIIKAIELLREEYGFKENFEITLQKHIPTQAGMAGGSTDGAAAIRALNKMLRLGMDNDKMVEIAKKVGADVPFCLRSRPAFVTGIGENLEHFRVHTPFYLLLVKPYKGVSTKVAFETLDFSSAQHPDCRKMRQALMNNDYDGVIQSLGNTLEQSAFKLVPQIAAIKKDLLAMGFDGALMSGSGSTVFALTRDPELLEKGAAAMRKKAAFIRKTELRPQETVKHSFY